MFYQKGGQFHCPAKFIQPLTFYGRATAFSPLDRSPWNHTVNQSSGVDEKKIEPFPISMGTAGVNRKRPHD